MSFSAYNHRDTDTSFIGESMKVGQKMSGADIGRQQPLQRDITDGSALDVQVGGGHYKKKAIQPVEFISANGLNFLEGCVVKRITRWRDKNGIEDLQKIKHEVDLLIEMEKRYGRNT